MSNISTAKLHIEELKKRLSDNNTISVDDFYEFYKDVYVEIKKSTVRWYISELKKEKIIRNISRGHYVLEDNLTDNSDDYIVLTMDVIRSSKLDYKEFNESLRVKNADLNRVIKEKYNYEREFSISQGDEIQILCPFDDRFSDLIIATLCFLRPFEIRYGISFGKIDGELKRNSWEMNGPIFWNARDCLTILKHSKEYNGVVTSEYSKSNKLSNRILPLINKALKRISEKQWEAIKFELLKEDIDVALDELNISKTSYYDRLSVSNFDEIKDSLNAISDVMKLRGVIK